MFRMALLMWGLVQAGKANPASVEEASAAALDRGDMRAVLELAAQGLATDPNDAWLLYDQGAALAQLGRLDEAVVALERAEASFRADAPWGRALASYRRALALTRLGRCGEAQLAVAHYATLMTELSRDVAADAQRAVAECDRQNVSGKSRAR
jgi:predicted Zn-dependent protease